MINISAALVKELRDKTGAGMMACKQALIESGGDMAKAQEILRTKGLAGAAKRSGRRAAEGAIDAYIHMEGRIGAMVEVNCETDFVARSEDFRKLAHDIAMQIAATNPTYIGTEEDIPDDLLPDEQPLLKQPFIRDPGQSIQGLVHEAIGKLGENIVVRRFARFELGA